MPSRTSTARRRKSGSKVQDATRIPRRHIIGFGDRLAEFYVSPEAEVKPTDEGGLLFKAHYLVPGSIPIQAFVRGLDGTDLRGTFVVGRVDVREKYPDSHTIVYLTVNVVKDGEASLTLKILPLEYAPVEPETAHYALKAGKQGIFLLKR